MTVPEIVLSAPVGPEGAPLLVLGPSLGTSAVLWATVAHDLARDFRVATWNLPGHGGAPTAADAFSVADLADGLAEAISAAISATPAPAPAPAPGTGALIAGVSLGGAVSLELAIRHPDLVAAAALLCTGARIGAPESWIERAALVRSQSTSALIVGSAQRWFAPGSMERNADISGRLLHALQDADDESYARCCKALAEFDARGRLAQITVPVLAIWGEHDTVTPESSLREIAEGVANGRLQQLAGAAHLPPADNPAGTIGVLRSFFHDPRGRHDPLGRHDPGAQQAPEGQQAPIGGSDDARRSGGDAVRRAVLSDAHVDSAAARTDEFTSDFQDFITRVAWGDIWSRPGLDRRLRSTAVLSSLIAHGHHDEFAMHVRAARRNGLSVDEIKEIILQSAVYSGVPAANTAFRIADEVLRESGDIGPRTAAPTEGNAG